MRLKSFNLSFGTQVFKACSDESRLRILHLIHQNGEMCITDLERILEFTQTKTSRHLQYLKNSGILGARKYNQWVFYSLKEEVQDIIKQLFQFLQKDQTLVKDQEIYNALSSNRELAASNQQLKNWLKQ